MNRVTKRAEMRSTTKVRDRGKKEIVKRRVSVRVIDYLFKHFRLCTSFMYGLYLTILKSKSSKFMTLALVLVVIFIS